MSNNPIFQRLPCIFYIVRHGQTEWNVTKKFQGQADIPLNFIGQSQAQKVAREFRNINFSTVFSSDLLRAKKTAEILNKERQLTIKSTALLRERYFGILQGKKRKELSDDLKQLLKDLFQGKKVSEDMESNEELSSRIIQFLRQTALAYLGKKVLLVTHAGPIIHFLQKMDYFPEQRIKIDNLAYVIVKSDGVEFKIESVHGIKGVDRK